MRRKSILVAGVGNIGSFFVRLLARMPDVGRVVLVDRDTYKHKRNLANQDILQCDLGKTKVAAQASRLAEIRPDLEIEAIHLPLESLPLGAWNVDLVTACLDSRAARQVVNERAWRRGVPWVDSGVMGSEGLTRVNAYVPGADAPCLECAWSEDDYRLIGQEYPCGAGEPAPNGAPAELGALAAALLAVECRKLLAGVTEGGAIGRQATLNARWLQFAVTSFRRNPRCRFDHATWRIEPLGRSLRTSPVGGLLELADTVRVPGQRFVRRLVCPACGAAKHLFHLDGTIAAAVRRCAACRRPMAATGFDMEESLHRGLPGEALNQTLEKSGLRRGHVLQAGDRYFEIGAGAVMENEK